MIYLSASRINLFSDCSLKYCFRYIDKIDKPSESIHLSYGTAIHKALEELNLSLLKTPFQLDDLFQSFHDEWKKELNIHKLESNFFRWTLYEMGLNSLKNYYDNNLDYEVLNAEIKFKVPIICKEKPELENYGLTGLIDVVIKRKNELTIVDYKTSKEAYTKFQLDTSVQLAIYSYAFRYILENNIINLGKIKKQKEDYISYYVIIKDYENKDGKIKIQRKAMTDLQCDKMFYIIEKVIQGEKQEIFIPNYSSSGCPYCEFKKECLEFKG